ncbi:MAG: MGMT family protein [Acidobacteria bacterium]|nr:MAG: MGMT family protein [Acidobacteriota bacterium]
MPDERHAGGYRADVRLPRGHHAAARGGPRARRGDPLKALTPFARRVLRVVSRIPAGRVATYGDVARLAGRPGAARAVGNILREAPEPRLPYHRVIAAAGALGGFGRSPHLKRSLLAAEGHTFRGRRLRNFSTRRWPE